MACAYLDTSARVKLYIEEGGTHRVLGLVAVTDDAIAVILDLAIIDARSAVRRRQRERDISGSVAAQILFRLERDASATFLVQPITAAVLEEAARLIDQYPLRAYDAIQLGGCLVVRDRLPEAPTFVCSDFRLFDVADPEGLAVLNPVSR